MCRYLLCPRGTALDEVAALLSGSELDYPVRLKAWMNGQACLDRSRRSGRGWKPADL